MTKTLLTIAGLAALAGCTTPTADLAASSCGQIHGNRLLQAELFFGRDIQGNGTVSDEQWAGFLRDIVTPRFPDGITSLAASGQWRDTTSGQITREPSFIVQIVAADTPRTLTSLTQIRTAYMQAFQQQSVGLTLANVCASFQAP